MTYFLYQIGLLSTIAADAVQLVKASQYVVITDANVGALYGEVLLRALQGAGVVRLARPFHAQHSSSLPTFHAASVNEDHPCRRSLQVAADQGRRGGFSGCIGGER